MVMNKKVTYAEWKFRADAETTLDNILKPLEMKVRKEKEKVYKLAYYEYYRWEPRDGWAELDRIAAQYNNLEEWEKRKSGMQSCLREVMELSTLPASPGTVPIRTNLRKFPGYTKNH